MDHLLRQAQIPLGDPKLLAPYCTDMDETPFPGSYSVVAVQEQRCEPSSDNIEELGVFHFLETTQWDLDKAMNILISTRGFQGEYVLLENSKSISSSIP